MQFFAAIAFVWKGTRICVQRITKDELKIHRFVCKPLHACNFPIARAKLHALEVRLIPTNNTLNAHAFTAAHASGTVEDLNQRVLSFDYFVEQTDSTTRTNLIWNSVSSVINIAGRYVDRRSHKVLDMTHHHAKFKLFAKCILNSNISSQRKLK